MEGVKLHRGFDRFFPGLLLLILAACAPRVAAPPAERIPPPPAGKVRGVAVAIGIDVPLGGATVSVGGRRAALSADNSFSLGEVEAGKHSVVVEKTFSSGAVRRILGISTIFVADNPVDIKITVRDATDVDAFCIECHPPARKAVRRDQKVRDLHPSGVVPRNARGDRTLLDGRGRVTCESCHTPHRAGEFPLFGRGEILQGVYCNRCHASGGK